MLSPFLLVPFLLHPFLQLMHCQSELDLHSGLSLIHI